MNVEYGWADPCDDDPSSCDSDKYNDEDGAKQASAQIPRARDPIA